MLADETENEIGRDRSNLVEAGFAKLAFYMIFLRKSEPTVGLHADVACPPGAFRGEHFGNVGFCAAGHSSIEQARGFFHHQCRGFHVRITSRDGKLHPLILADGAIEHDTVGRIGAGFVDEIAAVANALCRNEDPFCIHPIENHLEAVIAKRRRLLDGGLVDLFRLRYPDEQKFSWWDYRGGAFHRGMGLRIDFLLGTPALCKRTEDVWIDRDYRKKKDGLIASDHAPVIAELS